jgi:lipopolysaccharide/colanic/teichoic acid biosynthesis glycosyltransferase
VIKRIFDLFFSLCGLVILFPFFIAIALWIKLDSKGSVFFKQKRVGQFDGEIDVYKFRSMVTDAESKGLKITVGRDPRITNSGHFIRKYKIDELAQLINVVNGTMSLVGPRPEVREYINEYPKDIKDKVLSVKPGITDYASIEFKDENAMLEGAEDPHDVYINEILPIKQKFYIQYVDEQSILLDIKLIFKTIIAIIK